MIRDLKARLPERATTELSQRMNDVVRAALDVHEQIAVVGEVAAGDGTAKRLSAALAALHETLEGGP